MATTLTKQTVIDIFESNITSDVVLSDDLEDVWFERAIGSYSFEIVPIIYDESEDMFTWKDGTVITASDYIVAETLGWYMIVFHADRDKARIQARPQIVTKDISLNGRGDAYSAIENTYTDALNKLEDLLTKQKHPVMRTTSENTDANGDKANP